MLRLKTTTKFNKDLKLIKKRGYNIKRIAKDPNVKSYKTAEEAFTDILGEDY